jgi:hypothetical protein
MRAELTGRCPVCGVAIPLAMNGAVRKHRTGPEFGAPLCAGSGKQPKETGR